MKIFEELLHKKFTSVLKKKEETELIFFSKDESYRF